MNGLILGKSTGQVRNLDGENITVTNIRPAKYKLKILQLLHLSSKIK